MEIREVRDESERRAAVQILRQLWDEKDPVEVLEWTGKEDYHLFGGYVENELIGVAGVLIRDVLHHARHAWLYDLVIDESYRRQGYGTSLVEFVEQWAKERDCKFVALASPLTKEGVHQYYENQDFEIWGYVIEKDL